MEIFHFFLNFDLIEINQNLTPQGHEAGQMLTDECEILKLID